MVVVEDATQLTHRFWLGATEVTQGQWTGTAESFANSSWFGPNGSGTACGTNCPVEMVNWWETLAYANALSSAAGLGECYTLLGCGTAQPGNDKSDLLLGAPGDDTNGTKAGAVYLILSPY